MGLLALLNVALATLGVYRIETGIDTEITPWVTVLNIIAAAGCAYRAGQPD